MKLADYFCSNPANMTLKQDRLHNLPTSLSDVTRNLSPVCPRSVVLATVAWHQMSLVHWKWLKCGIAWTDFPHIDSTSTASFSVWAHRTVSMRADPAAVRRRLTSSTTFCIHGWSSGPGYAALNHWLPCSCRRRSTCLEQSSSRSAHIWDIFYFQNTPEVTSVQHIIPFSLTVYITDYFCTEPLKTLVLHTPL